MAPGDFHRAEVPFLNRPGSKNRIVLIVKELENDDVLVIESRGNPHLNLDLLGVVDFSRRGYAGLRVGGTSHFYAENLRVLKKDIISKDPVGGLTAADFKTFFDKIDALLNDETNEPTP
jgi:hypothetical protein